MFLSFEENIQVNNIHHPFDINPAGVTRSALHDTRVLLWQPRGSRLTFSPHLAKWPLNTCRILKSSSIKEKVQTICVGQFVFV